MSWKSEVIVDGSGKWASSSLRFATADEAWRNARDLSQRWTLVTDYRATECNDPVNYIYTPEGILRETSTQTRKEN